MTAETATELGIADALEAVQIARSSGDDPIAWITGNSYMPPLRDFGAAETVYQADEDGDLWEAYVEAFDDTLDKNDVLLTGPDHDNALFVVDLQRFEYIDEDDTAETLTDQWRAREAVSS